MYHIQLKWGFLEQFGFDGYDKHKHLYHKLQRAGRNCRKFRKHKNRKVWAKWQRIAMKIHLKLKSKRQ